MNAEKPAGLPLTTLGVTLGWFLIGICVPSVHGDGGTLRLSRIEGSYRISVLTAPTPLRAGPIDISVLVQDGRTGEPISDVRVMLTLIASNHHGTELRHEATTAAATNKLMKAAVFELPYAGLWTVEITVESLTQRARLRFDLDALVADPPWSPLWPWLAWPWLVVLLFSIHQLLIRLRRRQ